MHGTKLLSERLLKVKPSFSNKCRSLCQEISLNPIHNSVVIHLIGLTSLTSRSISPNFNFHFCDTIKVTCFYLKLLSNSFSSYKDNIPKRQLPNEMKWNGKLIIDNQSSEMGSYCRRTEFLNI